MQQANDQVSNLSTSRACHSCRGNLKENHVCYAGKQLPPEAQELPDLTTPADVVLLMDDGGCLPAHALILERTSELLADALVLARQQQGQWDQLTLSIPGASTSSVLQLLKAAYSLQPISYFKSLAELQPLQGLAEAAALLRCSALSELAEAALVNNRLVTPDNMLACSVWACQQRLLTFEKYCNAYVLHELQDGHQVDFALFQDVPFVSALEQVRPILVHGRFDGRSRVSTAPMTPISWPGSE